MVQILSSSGRTHIVVLGQHVSPHLSLLCYQMKGSVLPGSLGCCKDEPTEVKCFEGEDFLGNAAAAFYY